MPFCRNLTRRQCQTQAQLRASSAGACLHARKQGVLLALSPILQGLWGLARCEDQDQGTKMALHACKLGQCTKRLHGAIHHKIPAANQPRRTLARDIIVGIVVHCSCQLTKLSLA